MEKYGVNSPFNEGHMAFESNQSITTCPYTPGTTDERNWKAGWYEASDRATQKIDEDE